MFLPNIGKNQTKVLPSESGALAGASPGGTLPFFFWRSPVFGWKKRLNLRFRPEKAFGFRRKPFFFSDHLFLAGKNV